MGQPGTANFMLQLSQQSRHLTQQVEELEKRLRHKSEELALATDGQSLLREQLKESLDRCAASEARSRALTETAAARITSLRASLAHAQADLDDARAQLQELRGAEGAMRSLAFEAESRAAAATATAQSSLARAQQCADDAAVERTQLYARLAACQRAATQAERSEAAFRSLALEAETGRADEACAAAAAAARHAHDKAAADKERAELYRRLSRAEAAAAGAAAAERDAAMNGAAASNLAAQLEAATAAIDTATAARIHVRVAEADAEEGWTVQEAEVVSTEAVEVPSEVPFEVPMGASVGVPLGPPCGVFATSASDLSRRLAASVVCESLGAPAAALAVRLLVAAAVANVRARHAEEALERACAEFSILEAEMELEFVDAINTERRAELAEQQLMQREGPPEGTERLREAIEPPAQVPQVTAETQTVPLTAQAAPSSTEALAQPLARGDAKACVRAKGNLLSVDLSGMGTDDDLMNPFLLQWLDSASVADTANLRDLVAPTSRSLYAGQVTALCRALPLCRVCCGVNCGAVVALPLLRREPPFALLTIGHLLVRHNPGVEQAVMDLASALAGHKGMDKLSLFRVPLATRAVVDALVDAAISAGIMEVNFNYCELSQTALPALTRLLQSPGFDHLQVDNDNAALFEGPALPAFCEALRNCTSLKVLELNSLHLWDDTAAASQLIAALEGLPALQTVALPCNPTDGSPAVQQAAGECLARLIARSTSLRVLDVYGSWWAEAGMTPIFEALRGNTVLVKLSFGPIDDEELSADFARDVVLPAVHANTSLRTLLCLRPEHGEPLPAMDEVEDILEARRLADKEAA